MVSKKIWLTVSHSDNLSCTKKMPILVSNKDLEAAFNTFNNDCHTKYGKPPNDVMVYKPENDLDGNSTELVEASDLEGMLNEYPGGKGVRVIILKDGKH